ncbi:MAG: hypothetical protein ND866_18365 [Pyrinomonadaceae bacterium]|nr:hypothetical protein [Pyrinomonadaceae bacterium]
MSQQLATVERYVANGEELIAAARSLIGQPLGSMELALAVIEVLYGPEAVAKAHEWDRSKIKALAYCRTLRPYIVDLPLSEMRAGDVAVVQKQHGPDLGPYTLVGEHTLFVAELEPFTVIHGVSGRVVEQEAKGVRIIRVYRLREDGNVRDRVNLADGLSVDAFTDFEQLEAYATEETRRLKLLKDFDRKVARREKRAIARAEEKRLRLVKTA